MNMTVPPAYIPPALDDTRPRVLFLTDRFQTTPDRLLSKIHAYAAQGINLIPCYSGHNSPHSTTIGSTTIAFHSISQLSSPQQCPSNMVTARFLNDDFALIIVDELRYDLGKGLTPCKDPLQQTPYTRADVIAGIREYHRNHPTDFLVIEGDNPAITATAEAHVKVVSQDDPAAVAAYLQEKAQAKSQPPKETPATTTEQPLHLGAGLTHQAFTATSFPRQK